MRFRDQRVLISVLLAGVEAVKLTEEVPYVHVVKEKTAGELIVIADLVIDADGGGAIAVGGGIADDAGAELEVGASVAESNRGELAGGVGVANYLVIEIDILAGAGGEEGVEGGAARGGENGEVLAARGVLALFEIAAEEEGPVLDDGAAEGAEEPLVGAGVGLFARDDARVERLLAGDGVVIGTSSR